MWIASDEVPKVLPDDDGLRDIRPGLCFYCHQAIGQEHKRMCVCLNAKVRYKVTATMPNGIKFEGHWETHDPWAWFNGNDPDTNEYEGHWRFARNESSWCADNADVTWHDPEAEHVINEAVGKGGCSCGLMEFELDEVLDNRYHVSRKDGVKCLES